MGQQEPRTEKSLVTAVRFKHRLADFMTYFLLTVFCLAILAPILWIIRTSLATDVIAYEIPPRLVFKPTFVNYIELFSISRFDIHLRNSMEIALLSTLIATPIAALGGYAFARHNVGGEPLQFAVLGTQMLPGIVLILPLFAIYTRLKLVNTLTGIVLAYLAFNLPVLLWLFMGFFQGIPTELEEAALIDGCSPFEAFFRIIFPISAPGVMSAAVLSFILCWNEFLFALILTGSKTGTIPVAMASMQTQRGILIGKLSAATAIGILPMIIIAFSLRKYLVRGLSFGAIK